MNIKLSIISSLKFIPLLGGLLIIGCATRSEVPQPPINIPPNYAYKMGNSLNSTGFQLAAIDYRAISKYDKIIINVQMSDRLVAPGLFDNLKTGYLFYTNKEIQKELVNYSQNAFTSSFADNKYFKSALLPGQKTLKANVYITEIVINDAFFGSISNIPSPGWIIWKPIGMGMSYISNKSGGAVAIEIIVKDSVTDKIVALFQDREKGVFALLNTEGFSMTAADKRNIDFWAEDLASTLTQIKGGANYPTANKIAPLIKWIY